MLWDEIERIHGALSEAYKESCKTGNPIIQDEISEKYKSFHIRVGNKRWKLKLSNLMAETAIHRELWKTTEQRDQLFNLLSEMARFHYQVQKWQENGIDIVRDKSGAH